MIKTLKSSKGWKEHLQGKVVVCSSAGMYAVSKVYIPLSVKEPVFKKGLNLISYSAVAHYRSKKNTVSFWNKTDNLLNKRRDGLKTLKLGEGSFLEVGDD